jgi:hypothetical protein
VVFFWFLHEAIKNASRVSFTKSRILSKKQEKCSHTLLKFMNIKVCHMGDSLICWPHFCSGTQINVRLLEFMNWKMKKIKIWLLLAFLFILQIEHLDFYWETVFGRWLEMGIQYRCFGGEKFVFSREKTYQKDITLLESGIFFQNLCQL